MLTIFGSPRARFCDGIQRRDFLTIGGLALGGLTLPDLLRAERQEGGGSRHKGLILIYLPGGPPHQDLYDLKPDAPAEIRGAFKPISTRVPGVQICELLPRLAARMDRFAIIRSLVGSDGAHASTLCAAGRPFQNQPAGSWPSIGAVASAVQGQVRPAIPAAADLSLRMAHAPYNLPGAGFLAPRHAPVRPEGAMLADIALVPAKLTCLQNRRGLFEAFDNFRHAVHSSASASGGDDCTQQALEMLTSSKLVEALDLDKEDPRVRDRYGKDNAQALPYFQGGYQALQSRFLLARRLIEAGVRCVTVSFADFDWHGSNFVHARKVLPLFDQGITALVDDLHERGLEKDVTVIAWGEFGRTPRINKDAGRDHWPQVSCALLAGGGLRTGQAIGATNRLGEFATHRPVHYQEVFATLYHCLGLDGRKVALTDLGGRPHHLIDSYLPIQELV